MKKILFISNITYEVTNFSRPSINAAQKLGYKFHLAANLSNFIDDPTKYGIKLHHIDLARNPLSLRNIKAYRQLIRILENEKFDVIHCNTPIGGVLGRLGGKRTNIRKVIYSAHGFHFYEGAPLINNIIFKAIESYLARFTDVVITINKEDYDAASKFKLKNDGKVYYVPGVGINTKEIMEIPGNRKKILNDFKLSEDSVLLISVGELNQNKNNKVVIEALKKLNNPKVHYFICGEGPKKDFLQKLTQKYGLSKNIHFLGYRKDIPQLLKSVDIFVLPSHREGLSRSLMEAMSAGLPCIVSDIRGNIDLINDSTNGFIVNSNDVSGFADAIDVLSQNESLREEIKVSNINDVKKFDVENIKEIILNIYEKEIISS